MSITIGDDSVTARSGLPQAGPLREKSNHFSNMAPAAKLIHRGYFIGKFFDPGVVE